MVNEPIADQSSRVEIYIVPDGNKPGLLWPIPLVIGNEDIRQGVKEGDNVGSIVRTKSGMMMKDTILTNGCTHCDVATLSLTMAWCPMRFLPLRLVLARLKSTSST